MTTPPDRPETSAVRAALLDDVARSWDDLLDAVDGLDERQLLAPGPEGWSIKDHLAHLSSWERYLLVRLDGREPAAAMGLDGWPATVDAVNAELQALNGGSSLAEVRRRLDETHAEVLDRLMSLDRAQLDRWLGLIEGNTHAHVREHLAWMRALVG